LQQHAGLSALGRDSHLAGPALRPALFDQRARCSPFIVETHAVAPILGGEAGIAADPRNQRAHEAGRQKGECQHRHGIRTCLVPHQPQPLLGLVIGTRGQ